MVLPQLKQSCKPVHIFSKYLYIYVQVYKKFARFKRKLAESAENKQLNQNPERIRDLTTKFKDFRHEYS